MTRIACVATLHCAGELLTFGNGDHGKLAHGGKNKVHNNLRILICNQILADIH
jgi:hypothetical protein